MGGQIDPPPSRFRVKCFFPEKAILIEALVKQDIVICTQKGPGEKICGMNRKYTT